VTDVGHSSPGSNLLRRNGETEVGGDDIPNAFNRLS